MTIERRNISLFEVKVDTDEETGVFSGYGAFFGNEDSYGDVIEKGRVCRNVERVEGARQISAHALAAWRRYVL